MRRLLFRHRWINLLVVGLVLFSTSGASLSRMTCLTSGHSELSFGLADDCCPEDGGAEDAALKATCCEFSEAKAVGLTFVPNDLLVLAPVLMALDAAPVMIAAELSVARFTWLDSRPPPLLGSERLATIGSYLI